MSVKFVGVRVRVNSTVLNELPVNSRFGINILLLKQSLHTSIGPDTDKVHIVNNDHRIDMDGKGFQFIDIFCLYFFHISKKDHLIQS